MVGGRVFAPARHGGGAAQVRHSWPGRPPQQPSANRCVLRADRIVADSLTDYSDDSRGARRHAGGAARILAEWRLQLRAVTRERGDRGARAAAASAQSFGTDDVAPRQGRGGGGSTGGVNGSTIPAAVRSEWSEQDAMHVLELVKREYPIDPKRTFLFGYSAGGQGAHYFGQKYPKSGRRSPSAAPTRRLVTSTASIG